MNAFSEQDEPSSQQCGYVAIVGRPNVGKSTLLNCILGQKISITTNKPQTTRHQILGIKTTGDTQVVYVDTPGLHIDHTQKALNRYMNKAACNALKDVDVVVFVLDRTGWNKVDQLVLEKVITATCPVIVAINKVDMLTNKQVLLPFLQMVQEKLPTAILIPIAAKQGTQVKLIEQAVQQSLPHRRHYFPKDQITDRSARFVAAELVREKITQQLGDELPYQITVIIETFTADGAMLHINALILVERKGQKRILIGDQGERIKQIGRAARLAMENMFDTKVMLHLWVKVKSG